MAGAACPQQLPASALQRHKHRYSAAVTGPPPLPSSWAAPPHALPLPPAPPRFPPTHPCADSGRPKGFGFIEFQDLRDAEEAIYHLDKTLFNGREIQVGAARRAAARSAVVRFWVCCRSSFDWVCWVLLVATG